MTKTTDMTKGNPAKLILAFAFPMLISTIFQQLYGMIDTAIVGRGVGVSALAAVGSTGSITFLVIGFVSGLAYGFGILFSQRFGAADYESLKQTFAQSILVGAALSVAITALSIAGANALLKWMNTPDDIFSDASLYLITIFAAIPISLFYNLLSTALRAVGDSKTPLVAMIISSFVNIALDFLFVYAFKWGVFGVAIATVIAQGISCLICLRGIVKCDALKLKRKHFRRDQPLAMQLLRLGLPVAFMNSITAIGVMLLQSVVNGFGSLYVAGYTAADKLIIFLEQPGNTLGLAVGVYAGQNLGANRMDRIRKGVNAAIIISLILNASIGLLMYVGRDALVMIFLPAQDAAAVLPISGMLMKTMSLFMCPLGLLFIYRNTLQGMGDTRIPMISGIVELVRTCFCSHLAFCSCMCSGGLRLGRRCYNAGHRLLH